MEGSCDGVFPYKPWGRVGRGSVDSCKLWGRVGCGAVEPCGPLAVVPFWPWAVLFYICRPWGHVGGGAVAAVG